jgi:hypothetical protein
MATLTVLEPEPRSKINTTDIGSGDRSESLSKVGTDRMGHGTWDQDGTGISA